MVAYAQKYINVNLVSVYFYGMYDLQKRFLNCLNISWVPMIVQVCASFLHIFWCYFFVEVYQMDIEGLGIASTVTSLILIIFAVVYPVFIKEVQDALVWPDSSVWSGWKEYFSLGVPTTGMLCAEYWAWESLAFISGHLGVTA